MHRRSVLIVFLLWFLSAMAAAAQQQSPCESALVQQTVSAEHLPYGTKRRIVWDIPSVTEALDSWRNSTPTGDKFDKLFSAPELVTVICLTIVPSSVSPGTSSSDLISSSSPSIAVTSHYTLLPCEQSNITFYGGTSPSSGGNRADALQRFCNGTNGWDERGRRTFGVFPSGPLHVVVNLLWSPTISIRYNWYNELERTTLEYTRLKRGQCSANSTTPLHVDWRDRGTGPFPPEETYFYNETTGEIVEKPNNATMQQGWIRSDADGYLRQNRYENNEQCVHRVICPSGTFLSFSSIPVIYLQPSCGNVTCHSCSTEFLDAINMDSNVVGAGGSFDEGRALASLSELYRQDFVRVIASSSLYDLPKTTSFFLCGTNDAYQMKQSWPNDTTEVKVEFFSDSSVQYGGYSFHYQCVKPPYRVATHNPLEGVLRFVMRDSQAEGLTVVFALVAVVGAVLGDVPLVAQGSRTWSLSAAASCALSDSALFPSRSVFPFMFSMGGTHAVGAAFSSILICLVLTTLHFLPSRFAAFPLKAQRWLGRLALAPLIFFAGNTAGLLAAEFLISPLLALVLGGLLLVSLVPSIMYLSKKAAVRDATSCEVWKLRTQRTEWEEYKREQKLPPRKRPPRARKDIPLEPPSIRFVDKEREDRKRLLVIPGTNDPGYTWRWLPFFHLCRSADRTGGRAYFLIELCFTVAMAVLAGVRSPTTPCTAAISFMGLLQLGLLGYYLAYRPYVSTFVGYHAISVGLGHFVFAALGLAMNVNVAGTESGESQLLTATGVVVVLLCASALAFLAWRVIVIVSHDGFGQAKDRWVPPAVPARPAFAPAPPDDTGEKDLPSISKKEEPRIEEATATTENNGGRAALDRMPPKLPSDVTHNGSVDAGTTSHPQQHLSTPLLDRDRQEEEEEGERFQQERRRPVLRPVVQSAPSGGGEEPRGIANSPTTSNSHGYRNPFVEGSFATPHRPYRVVRQTL